MTGRSSAMRWLQTNETSRERTLRKGRTLNMKLIVKNESGLSLLRPSKRHLKVTWNESVLRWDEVLETKMGGQRYASEVQIGPGAHEVERIENPFVPGGEPWLVLKGSRIGAAEAYLRRLAASTQGTANAVELVLETIAPSVWPTPQRSAA